MTDEFEPELVAPFNCQCGSIFLVPIVEVVVAAVHTRPLTCPDCGERYATTLDGAGNMRFYDRAAWDAWDDTVPDTEPDHYAIGQVGLDLSAVDPAYTPSPN